MPGPKHFLVRDLYSIELAQLTGISTQIPDVTPRVLLCDCIGDHLLQKIRAFGQRRKLRVVAQYKHSAETSWQSNFLERISPADGNCLFYSLADAQAMLPSARPDNDAGVTGHAAIRREIIDYFRVLCGGLSVGDTGMLLRDYVQAEITGVSFDR